MIRKPLRTNRKHSTLSKSDSPQRAIIERRGDAVNTGPDMTQENKGNLDQPSTSQNDPHICARCAEVHTTCCFVTPGDEEHCFPLSESEWKRIVEFCDSTGGFSEQKNTQPFIDTLNKLFPNDKAKLAETFPPHGTHRTLASREDGPCFFLTKEGCSLPRDVRPWYCRLYPFWVRSGMLTMFTAMGCLICKESKTIPEALEKTQLTVTEVRRIFGQLRIAWGLDPDDNQL